VRKVEKNPRLLLPLATAGLTAQSFPPAGPHYAPGKARNGIVLAVEQLKATVKNGRLVLDAPTDLPEGSVVELALLHDDDEDPELLRELAASADDEAAGHVIDFEAAIAHLGTKRSP
jgi:hypothetical protein